MTQLFKQAEKTDIDMLAEEFRHHRLSDDPSAWPSEILAETMKQNPVVASTLSAPVMEQMDDKERRAVGHIITRKEAGDTVLVLPFFVHEGKLADVDIYLKGDRPFPITDERIQREFFSPEIVDAVNKSDGSPITRRTSQTPWENTVGNTVHKTASWDPKNVQAAKQALEYAIAFDERLLPKLAGYCPNIVRSLIATDKTAELKDQAPVQRVAAIKIAQVGPALYALSAWMEDATHMPETHTVTAQYAQNFLAKLGFNMAAIEMASPEGSAPRSVILPVLRRPVVMDRNINPTVAPVMEGGTYTLYNKANGEPHSCVAITRVATLDGNLMPNYKMVISESGYDIGQEFVGIMTNKGYDMDILQSYSNRPPYLSEATVGKRHWDRTSTPMDSGPNSGSGREGGYDFGNDYETQMIYAHDDPGPGNRMQRWSGTQMLGRRIALSWRMPNVSAEAGLAMSPGHRFITVPMEVVSSSRMASSRSGYEKRTNGDDSITSLLVRMLDKPALPSSSPGSMDQWGNGWLDGYVNLLFSSGITKPVRVDIENASRDVRMAILRKDRPTYMLPKSYEIINLPPARIRFVENTDYFRSLAKVAAQDNLGETVLSGVGGYIKFKGGAGEVLTQKLGKDAFAREDAAFALAAMGADEATTIQALDDVEKGHPVSLYDLKAPYTVKDAEDVLQAAFLEECCDKIAELSKTGEYWKFAAAAAEAMPMAQENMQAAMKPTGLPMPTTMAQLPGPGGMMQGAGEELATDIMSLSFVNRDNSKYLAEQAPIVEHIVSTLAEILLALRMNPAQKVFDEKKIKEAMMHLEYVNETLSSLKSSKKE